MNEYDNDYVPEDFDASEVKKTTIDNYFYDYPINVVPDVNDVTSELTEPFDNNFENVDNNNGKSNSTHSSEKQIDTYKNDLPIIAIDVVDDAFVDFFINNGDVLLVEPDAEIYQDAKLLVSMNGKYSIKIYKEIEDIKYLQTADKKYLPFEILPYIEFKIIGIVTGIVHNNQDDFLE